MTPVYLFNSYETAPRRRVFEIMRGTLPRLRSGAAFSDFWARMVWVACGAEPQECNGPEFFARLFLKNYLCLIVLRDESGAILFRLRYSSADTALSVPPDTLAAQKRAAATTARAELPKIYDQQTLIDAAALIAAVAAGSEPTMCGGPCFYARQFLARFFRVDIRRDEWGACRAFVAS